MTGGLVRTAALEVLATYRGAMLSVVTMQAVDPWIALGQADDRNFNVVGCMGSAASIGLGLALARPTERVLVIDGDGSILMQLGSLVTVGDRQPSNLYHAVMENGTYETSGGQPVPGRDAADLCAIALGSGYKRAVRCSSTQEMVDLLPGYLEQPGPTLISLRITSPGALPADVAITAADKPTQIRNMLRTLTSSA